MRQLRQWLYDNSLSATFFGLFVAALLGQSFAGRSSYNTELSAHHMQPVTYLHYLGTGNFLDAIFTNWQAAILQLGCLILFGSILHQKGASHSRKPEGDSGGRARAKDRDGDHAPWIYRHSLSLAFGALFAVSLLAHMFFGTSAYNETRSLTGQHPVSVAAYLGSGTFWFKLTQTWEAEFSGIGLFIVLSIVLREQQSAESKPVESDNKETGDTNE